MYYLIAEAPYVTGQIMRGRRGQEYQPMNAPEKIHFTRKQRFEAGKLESACAAWSARRSATTA